MSQQLHVDSCKKVRKWTVSKNSLRLRALTVPFAERLRRTPPEELDVRTQL